MAAKVNPSTFRTTFKSLSKDLVRWFPGHMGRGLKQMQQKLKSVDCIIEVHDARVPLSGLNPDFKLTLGGVKPHILVLNKIDLIEHTYREGILKALKRDYENIIFTACSQRDCKGVEKLFPLARNLINNSDRFNRSENKDYNIMIIGVPNVGKSSLINALRIKYLRRGKATLVGASPGITKSVLNKIKMCDDPLFYLLDTPGILSPTIKSVESGLKLAVCATLQDHLVGEIIIADYLLYCLNKYGYFDYVNHFKLDHANDNILEVLYHICKTHNKFFKVRDTSNNYVLKPNLEQAAKIILTAFRQGTLGKVLLDRDLLEDS